MTTEAAILVPRTRRAARRPGVAGPVLAVALAILAIWYAAAVWLNGSADTDWTARALAEATLSQERPLLPAPHQIAGQMWKAIVDVDVTSPRSLVHHAWVTLAATLPGFALGAMLGILLAVFTLASRTLRKGLLPWFVFTQAIPMLALAPLIIAVLAALGLKGLMAKAIVAAALSLFPVTIAMAKGLRLPDAVQLDLMHTVFATPTQTFFKLRWPGALPVLLPSLKTAIALALVGVMVAELPGGDASGLGARLLSAFRGGRTIELWAVLVTAFLVATALIMLIAIIERMVLGSRGGRS